MSRKAGKAKGDKAQQEGDSLTSVFTNDFPLLCAQQGLPPVPVRTLPRPQATLEEECPPAGGATQSGHTVLVDKDSDDQHSIRKLYVRGFLVDNRVMSALCSGLEETRLHSLIFWNTGLLEEVQEKLPALVRTSAIKHLVLDANDISPKIVSALLTSTSLEQLSLKSCRLQDSLLSAISSDLASNRSLLTFDLSCNLLTDTGANHLARVLRINRSLISLGLSRNKIGDAGMEALCKALVKFPLNKDEECKRKKLLADKEGDITRECTIMRSSSVLSLSGRGSKGSTGKGKKGDSKKEDKKKEDRGSCKGSSTNLATKGSKPKGGGKKGGGGGGKVEEEVGIGGEGADTGEPLLDLVTEEGGRLWMKGNHTLAHLTLSYNRMTVNGLRTLTHFLLQQRAPPPSTSPPPTNTPTLSQPSAGTGLLRVTFEHNLFSPHCAESAELKALLVASDPLKATLTDSETTPTT